MTKTQFIDAFRLLHETQHLARGYPSVAVLNHLMKRVDDTLRHSRTTWHCSKSANALHVWRALGGTGVPTRRALRALPE